MLCCAPRLPSEHRESPSVIIDNQQDVTPAVLAEIARADNPRFREIMSIAVKHLHSFVREAKLTEAEFQQACGVLASLGQHTTPSHNEVVLAAGSLGISQLVCLINNGEKGTRETSANMLGPFWRTGAPQMATGASIAHPSTPGVPLFVKAWVKDVDGNPVAGAAVDVWHTSAEGYYENQDPQQPDMNLRGIFTTDAEGRIHFRSVKPAGYPIPVNGPVGELIRAQHRHNMRPAHVHFLISKEGFKTQFSQVYSGDDPHLETDVQYGVTRALIGTYVLHENEAAPLAGGAAGVAPAIAGPWYSLDFHFVIEPGLHKMPRAPITGKAAGPRPAITVLARS